MTYNDVYHRVMQTHNASDIHISTNSIIFLVLKYSIDRARVYTQLKLYFVNCYKLRLVTNVDDQNQTKKKADMHQTILKPR